MADSTPVFINLDTPKNVKDPKDVELNENVTSKEGVEVNVKSDSSGLVKRGFKISPKETQNPKTV
jgi:hypothetical protein